MVAIVSTDTCKPTQPATCFTEGKEMANTPCYRFHWRKARFSCDQLSLLPVSLNEGNFPTTTN